MSRVFADIRFLRDGTAFAGPVEESDLLAMLTSLDFEFVIAEPVGQDSRAGSQDFAQAAGQAGAYRFEVSTSAGLSGTMLATAQDVVSAFSDWARQREGWRSEHRWD